MESLRERLQVQDFTAAQARRRFAERLASWARDPVHGDRWSGEAPDERMVEDEIRQRLADVGAPFWENVPDSHPLNALFREDEDFRSLTRLLLECAPEPQAEVRLDLTEIAQVHFGPRHPVASSARAAQLDRLDRDAPLLVLTEGTTDARLLAAGMEVTHPYLNGFVTFFDFATPGAEGGVAQLAKTVSAFAAAGVANRFVALADNDTESHAGLAKLKSQPLPERCRVLHYPSLPFLRTYPTLGPYTDEPVLTDINGTAGSLEMYLGRDALQGDADRLLPVQWRSWNPRLRRYQGSLIDADKQAVQERFRRKVEAHRAGDATGDEDWSGIRAIIDTIVNAFE
ncbi:hypothetical protein O3Q52_32290 [Streptomyces sp. ActVer]|uniref:hypothetical protein n=1 Tax=Streptomyces sp. ActVer TaxID=3014558 RepID=UPI0022B49F2B|nr:hypothetical protein [Streptomyces sp. ActVer]MCZ4512760.1 hypothetical protein [Streptomyces sp. ActVer]